MRKLLLVLYIIISVASNTSGQIKKDTSVEAAINTFLHYPETAKWLLHGTNIKEDSTFYFVDLNNIIQRPFTNTWIGCKFTFVKDKMLIDSLNHFQPHLLLKDRPNYFVVISRKKSLKKTEIILLHAYNNMAGNSTIIQRGKFYFNTKISMVVF